MRLLLFDVDGTLLLSGGAGMRAFYRAFQQVFQVAVVREVIRPDGRTDPWIAREMLAHFGLEQRWSEPVRNALFHAYLEMLEEEMSLAAAGGALRVLPGVLSLLDVLARQPDFALGLATGNLEQGTEIKLRHAGLDRYFRFGGFGSDSDDRTELIRLGMGRGTRLCAPQPIEAAFVIGDTPLDIVHGHEAGARVLAVASARYSVKELEPYRPEKLVPDLSAVDDILSFFRE
jgi:phosphoglycolate phosphatase-like HAD superfamily hydrolase